MSLSRKFGVIGNPIEHSLSPVMHNTALKVVGFDAVYEKVLVEKEKLATAMQEFREGRWDGLNVTLPFKVDVLPFMDQIDQSAKEIGAANTIVRRDGNLIAYNTDGEGYWTSLQSEVVLDSEFRTAIVLGAGGAARAIATTLKYHDVEKIIIVNRDLEKAKRLVGQLKMDGKRSCEVLSWDQLRTDALLADTGLLVNTTSMGMDKNPWGDLSFLSRLPSSCVVSDIVYKPKNTQLLQQATQEGLAVHYGLGMLLYQGVLAFEKFTNQKAPVAIMKKALEEALS